MVWKGIRGPTLKLEVRFLWGLVVSLDLIDREIARMQARNQIPGLAAREQGLWSGLWHKNKNDVLKKSKQLV